MTSSISALTIRLIPFALTAASFEAAYSLVPSSFHYSSRESSDKYLQLEALSWYCGYIEGSLLAGIRLFRGRRLRLCTNVDARRKYVGNVIRISVAIWRQALFGSGRIRKWALYTDNLI